MKLSKLIFAILLLFACDQTGSSLKLEIPGVIGPTIYQIESTFLISMVLENYSLDGGLRANIPNYDNSYLELGPDVTTGGTLLSLNISLDDILAGKIDHQPTIGLPGGRNIPGIQSGRLPATAFTVRDEEGNGIFRNVTLYLGNSYFGIFVPIEFPENVQLPGGVLTTRYFIGDKRAGNISLVSPDTDGEHGGVFLLLNLDTTRKTLEKMMATPIKRLLWDNL